MKTIILLWLKHKVGCNSKLKFSRSRCYYDTERDIIYFKFNDKLPGFESHLKDKHNYHGSYNSDLFAFLHLAGHAMTEFKVHPSRPIFMSLNAYLDYYDKKEEFGATEWAINWINTNTELWNKLVKIFK